MDSGVECKLSELRNWFSGKKRVLVAFSGGVDSTLVAAVAREVLGGGAVAVTVKTDFTGKNELEEARRAANNIGIRHLELEVKFPDSVLGNPPERCYLCKALMVKKLVATAESLGIDQVVDGTNIDDLSAGRAGIRALVEGGVRSPLAELGIGKSTVREMSKSLALDHSKPSNACLATRFPTNHRISAEELERVAEAEAFLKCLGFTQVRVRALDGMARIELDRGEMMRIFDLGLLDTTVKGLKALGFDKIALDLEGYRSGSMD